MIARDRTPVMAWAALGMLGATAALVVLASQASGPLALGLALAGVAARLLLAWAAPVAATRSA